MFQDAGTSLHDYVYSPAEPTSASDEPQDFVDAPAEPTSAADEPPDDAGAGEACIDCQDEARCEACCKNAASGELRAAGHEFSEATEQAVMAAGEVAPARVGSECGSDPAGHSGGAVQIRADGSFSSGAAVGVSSSSGGSSNHGQRPSVTEASGSACSNAHDVASGNETAGNSSGFVLLGASPGWLARRRSADGGALVRQLLRQLLRAAAALHAAGITHRDIKPENVLIEQGERIDDVGVSPCMNAGAIYSILIEQCECIDGDAVSFF